MAEPRLNLLLRLSLLALWAADAPAQVPPEAEARLRAIYERRALEVAEFRGRWVRDSSAYTVLERPGGEAASELVRYEVAGGARSVLASPSQLLPPGAAAPLVIEDYELSPDGRWLLIQTEGREARGRRLVDLWALERGTGALRRIVRGADPIPAYGSFSPDGGRLVYTFEANLHVDELERGRTLPLSEDGAPDSVANGRAAWSPDGRWVAYVQADSSGVARRPVLVPVDPSYPEVRLVRFARAGATIPKLRVGVVEAGGGSTRWLEVPAADEGFYLGEVGWAGNSRELLVERLSRARDAREFLIFDHRTGALTRLHRETDPAWVDASYRTNAGLAWIRGGRAAVMLSEKDGWRRAYVVARDGSQELLLTPGASDVVQRGAVDEAGGWFYFLASPEDATRKYLYRVALDGTKKPERLTPSNLTGSHHYDYAPNARWAFHTRSTFDSPPVTELVTLPEHRSVRVLEDNRELRDRLAPLIALPTEFLELDIGEGVTLDAWMIKPRAFDPGRRYPVLVYVYGEPHSQTVLDQWSGAHLYHRVVADLGYLVVSMDNRGTPAPKGAPWRRAVFGSLGPLSTEEQARGLLELGRTRPYVDGSRVGVWGWSGGGSNTLNAMFRKPQLYHVGIAVAPKPQPHLYNAWFQEIYMRTPEANPEGYRRSAPIHFAEGLQGHLLIIHGTGETNTHLEITEGLVDRLIALGKRFDYMAYPHRDHGLREGEGTPLHLRMLMTRYLLEHLPPGPAARPD